MLLMVAGAKRTPAQQQANIRQRQGSLCNPDGDGICFYDVSQFVACSWAKATTAIPFP
jgi:hypothetical protein